MSLPSSRVATRSYTETTGDEIDDNMPAATRSATAPNANPLILKVHDVETLTQSEGFCILRQHLATHYAYDLCDEHTLAHLEDAERWLLTRDVLHALLVPVVELFEKACGVAAAATHATRIEDLEFAFTGHARSAFIWLQCFLSSEKESDWCYTRGCPACIVDHCLDSEFTVRLLYAACLLSDVHYPFTIEGPTLPSFMFFLDTLESAVSADELFGKGFFETLQAKAIATRDGVEDLIHACLELDAFLSRPSSPYSNSLESSLPASPMMGPLGGTPGIGIQVKRSKMAKTQLRLQVEEEQWMQTMLRCLEHLQVSERLGLSPCPTHSLDAVLKSEPTVAICEVAPE